MLQICLFCHHNNKYSLLNLISLITNNKCATLMIFSVKTGLMCSGHGECDSCGNCQCDCLPGGLEPLCDRYTGPVCQCNNKACSQRNGRLCSGELTYANVTKFISLTRSHY